MTKQQNKRTKRQTSQTSRTNSRVSQSHNASTNARRSVTPAKNLGGEQVEGRRAVCELLHAARRRVREVWISDTLDESELVDEIHSLATEAHTQVRLVPRARITQMAKSDAPQGIIAFAAPLREYTLDDLLHVERPFVLILEEVTDPHNIGALLRTADCAGVTGVILPKHRSAHITPTVAKASAGAIEHMPIALVAGVPAALTECKNQGVWTVGLDPQGETSIFDIAVADQPIALVLGSEGAGLSRLTTQRCDVLARIDQYGAVASLNVSAAGAVASFAIAHARNGSHTAKKSENLRRF